MNFVKVVVSDGYKRVIKCDKSGKQIGKLFVTFPKRYRKKEGQMFLVKKLKIANTSTKKYWVALKEKEIIKINW